MTRTTDRMLLLTSTAAGSSAEPVLERVTEVCRDEGWDVTVHRLGDDDSADGPLEKALGRVPGGGSGPLARLVLAGGDGTVHHVLAGLDDLDLLRPDQPIGLVPLGTGNDLARGVGLPLDPERAARHACGSDTRRMDVAVDSAGTLVVNAAHVGIGALAAERASSYKAALGPLGYVLGAAAAGVQASTWPMRVLVDGAEVVDRDQPLLMAGVAVGRTIGGGSPLAPEAAPDDGAVDVVVVSATGPLARLDFARRLRAGTHDERDDVLVVRGGTVRIEAATAPLNVDGELVGETGTRTWTVRRHAWSLVAPPE